MLKYDEVHVSVCKCLFFFQIYCMYVLVYSTHYFIRSAIHSKKKIRRFFRFIHFILVFFLFFHFLPMYNLIPCSLYSLRIEDRGFGVVFVVVSIHSIYFCVFISFSLQKLDNLIFVNSVRQFFLFLYFALFSVRSFTCSSFAYLFTRCLSISLYGYLFCLLCVLLLFFFLFSFFYFSLISPVAYTSYMYCVDLVVRSVYLSLLLAVTSTIDYV